jgi:hypothetical protein
VWLLSLGCTAAFVVALVLFVNAEDRTANQPAGVTSRSALVQQTHEAELIVGRDQAPHAVSVAAHVGPAVAIRAAVVAYMKRQIASGAIDGPLTSSGCARAHGSTGTRPAFRCEVVAASVRYPFLGVVDTAARQVTYCKRDAPPVPSMNIPVSPRCT